MKKIHKILQTCMILIFIISSCVEDSPLSDIEINDPSLIAPTIKIFRSRNQNGELSSGIFVWLYDKNYNSVALKKGDVRVNGTSMKIYKTLITKAPFYSTDSIKDSVSLNTNYNFEIELSDGKVYTASIKTQAKDLYKLIVPSSYNMQNDLTISWKDIDETNNMTLQLNCYYKADTSKGESLKFFTIPEDSILKGSYSVPKENFNTPIGIYKIEMTLTASKEGLIDQHFRSNSEIKSLLIIEGETIIE